MAGEDLQPELDQQGESEAITYTPKQDDQKIEVEIREVVMVRPQDFHALKNSFEEWASKWE